ncbi:hypothetical protein BCR37DRAFT_241807 [Protomyces lactucae-debilis]|uniref:Homeodomain-like protein n=1 Tax=Protomyces lactucae-debilis TaxID=2754530 RepID=A0A1Y2FNL5_PROLT|nr:uncharacterized protein BCR37DRAFT_241807 [Protomyces lactucae-debilis]ORY85558.1 hypothetical protein BCR37DRAFT_241807 [Protomyces lactucae-debilis]
MYSAHLPHAHFQPVATLDLTDDATRPLMQQPWTPTGECPTFASPAMGFSSNPYVRGPSFSDTHPYNGQLVSPPNLELDTEWYFPEQSRQHHSDAGSYGLQGLGMVFGPPVGYGLSGPWSLPNEAATTPMPFQAYYPRNAGIPPDRHQLVTPPYEQPQCLHDMTRPGTEQSVLPLHSSLQHHERIPSNGLIYSPRQKRPRSTHVCSNIDTRDVSTPPPLMRTAPYSHQQTGSGSCSSSATDVTGCGQATTITPDSSVEASPQAQQQSFAPKVTNTMAFNVTNGAQSQPHLQRIVKSPPRPMPLPQPGGRPVNKIGMTIGVWTKQDDAELLALIHAHLAKDDEEPIPWAIIGRGLGAPRSGQQCQAHWSEALDPKVVRGRWTPTLDKQLLHLTAYFEKKWARISEQIPGKTQRQCRSRWFALQSKADKAK